MATSHLLILLSFCVGVIVSRESLSANDELRKGETLVSSNGKYKAVFEDRVTRNVSLSFGHTYLDCIKETPGPLNERLLTHLQQELVLSRLKMPSYTVNVFTGNLLFSSTLNNIYIKLVGEAGESTRTLLKGTMCFHSGAESQFKLKFPQSLGKLVLVELDKQPQLWCPEDAWFCEKVEVTSPEGPVYKFPIVDWIEDNELHIFREGTALRIDKDHHLLGKYSREMELKQRRREYCWNIGKDGLPHNMKADDPSSLPPEVQFSYTKDTEFKYTAAQALIDINLTCLAQCKEPWTSFDDIYQVFCRNKTDASGYVYENWKEDTFFGYQFLNGLNPILIRRCTSLPSNLPLTNEMVSLEGCATFSEEIQKGNIFLCDYKNLDGVETNIINGEEQYLMAPLVLLHKTPKDELMPIAIQLKQTPARDNPIFLPTDKKYDWLLAKTFVRSADFNEHQLNAHLLRTHLLAEAFSVSLLRNLPMVHPLYKLLVAHTRYTLQINLLARQSLISKDGVFTKFAASGGEGMFTILKRSLASITYSSLCIPDDIAERGVESLPNYFYRDDGLKLWEIIHKFVKGVLSYYYETDDDVKKDTELQDYINDIFVHGFLSNENTGIPQKFNFVDELVKFSTMVIFLCSAQHSAVNTGQFDYDGWMPNTPISLQLPPPTKKGTATVDTLLRTLPDVNATAHGMATVYLLSKESTDFVALGQYPHEHFTEEVPCNMIKDFQKELKDLDDAIENRNKSLALPYTYLSPKQMENSVSL